MRTGRHIHCHRWRSASISDKCLSPSASPSPQTPPFDTFPIRELENRKIRWEVFTNKGGGVPPVIGKIPWKWVPSSFILLTFIAKTYRGQRPILQNILLCAGVSAIITRILYRKSKIKVIQWYFQSKTVTMVELKVDIPSNVKPFRQYICQVPENNSFGFFSPGGPRTICGDVDQSKTLSNTPLIGHYFCAKFLWHSIILSVHVCSKKNNFPQFLVENFGSNQGGTVGVRQPAHIGFSLFTPQLLLTELPPPHYLRKAKDLFPFFKLFSNTQTSIFKRQGVLWALFIMRRHCSLWIFTQPTKLWHCIKICSISSGNMGTG